MKIRKSLAVLYPFALLLFLTISGTVIAQDSLLTLTKKQALEDFNWLRFSLEYAHPRIYKYDNKNTVDARFDSISRLIHNNISGLDFLSLVTRANASLHCGHLYTIPQGKLGKEVLEKKVLPLHIKILNDKMYILYDGSNLSLPNGSQILSINGKTDREIIKAILPGITADGHIQTRKLRLVERYFYYPFQGFDLYYQLIVDRSNSFKINYLEGKTKIKKTVTVKGLDIKERQELLLKKYGVDEQNWFKIPSPKFEINEQNNYAVLTVSRSFYDEKVDPNFDSLLSTAFRQIKEKKISNLILDVRNNEGGSEYQQMELMSYLYNQPFKLYQNIYLSHLDYRPLKPIIIE